MRKKATFQQFRRSAMNRDKSIIEDAHGEKNRIIDSSLVRPEYAIGSIKEGYQIFRNVGWYHDYPFSTAR